VLPEEILKKVRLIELTTRKVVDTLMSGSYKSHFKGHGVQFSEHRQYVAGDDVRHIDWKASARARDPLVKKYEEERELTVFLVVDVSRSEAFGSGTKLKSQVAAELAGMLAYAAIHTGDRVGALLFAGEIEKIIPPKKGKQHILRIIRDVLAYEPRSKAPGTDLKTALEAAGRIMKHSGVIFVLSDFLAEGYETSIKRLSRKHDVVGVRIGDPRELDVPSVGHLLVVDPETGEERFIDSGSYAFKTWLKGFRDRHEGAIDSAFKQGRAELLNVSAREDYVEAVVRFFMRRNRRR
jgi:uncharacterized protein (DUF58 family)